MTGSDALAERQIPVTLVSGFLGAGKTTLVNRMLRNADGLRLAVLVNDFGAVNIDAELIEGAVENVVALKNGCICCSLTGGLLAAISGVLRWPIPPDAIVVEGSGVADPLEVARALSDPELQRHAPLDGIVTIVDAAGFDAFDGEALALACQQVATADLVLLNKADLVDEATLVAMETRLATLAPGTRIIRCASADVPLCVLLGLAGTNVETGFACEPAPAAHDAFESIVIERSTPIPMQRLHDVLSQLPDRVYRVKGILHLAERPQQRFVLQATGRRASITVGKPWGDDPAGNRIVLIAARGALDASAMARLNGLAETEPLADG